MRSIKNYSKIGKMLKRILLSKIKFVCNCLAKSIIKLNIGCMSQEMKKLNKHFSINCSKPQERQITIKNRLILQHKILHQALVPINQNKVASQKLKLVLCLGWPLLA
jgi:hypothetical protein